METPWTTPGPVKGLASQDLPEGQRHGRYGRFGDRSEHLRIEIL